MKDSLEVLVVDEADLVFSYGYEDDVKAVLRYGNLIMKVVLSSSWVDGLKTHLFLRLHSWC